MDEHFRTNVPHIYAVGDVIGFPALASHERRAGPGGRVPRLRVGRDQADVAAVLPTGIYTIPEVERVGADRAAG